MFWNATEFRCNVEKSPVDDVADLLNLIAEIRKRHAVDPRRIYLVGHSNGGFMTNRLLCEAPGLFGAAASFTVDDLPSPAV